MEDVLFIKDFLTQGRYRGLALDVDETLAWTNGYWIEQMQALFGNPECLNIQETIKKYRYTQNVPYWKTPEAIRWMEEQRDSNEVQEKLPLIQGVQDIVSKINDIIPIVLYITARSEKVKNGTESWLKRHQFPSAKVLTRPESVLHSEGNKWKAEVVSTLFPYVLGIIDDNRDLLQYMPRTYEGTIFLYDNAACVGSQVRAIPCQTWKDVLENVYAWSQQKG